MNLIFSQNSGISDQRNKLETTKREINDRNSLLSWNSDLKFSINLTQVGLLPRLDDCDKVKFNKAILF